MPYNEQELPDKYPVYPGYFYVLDGREYISDMRMTVGELKHYKGVKVITSCDVLGRDLLFNPPIETWGRYLDE